MWLRDLFAIDLVFVCVCFVDRRFVLEVSNTEMDERQGHNKATENNAWKLSSDSIILWLMSWVTKKLVQTFKSPEKDGISEIFYSYCFGIADLYSKVAHEV